MSFKHEANEETRLREVVGTAQGHTASWEENQPTSQVSWLLNQYYCFQEMMWEFLPDSPVYLLHCWSLSGNRAASFPPSEGPGRTVIKGFLYPAWDLHLQSLGARGHSLSFIPEKP